jgi:hypothetical protein
MRYPKPVWSLDLVRGALFDGRPFCAMSVIDESSREALHIECGTPIPPTRIVRVLNQLLKCHGKPKAIRLDGLLLAADIHDWVRKYRVQLLLIEEGKRAKKASAERFSRSVHKALLGARYDWMPVARDLRNES